MTNTAPKITVKSFEKIDPLTFRGSIPNGADIVIAEEHDTNFEDAIVLYGFDEFLVYMSWFKNPVVGFLTLEIA